MIVKTFTADSAAAALKQIRAEFGADAVILKTTKGTGPGGRNAVYVTACADQSGRAATAVTATSGANRLTEIADEKMNISAAAVSRNDASVRPVLTPTSAAANSALKGFQLLTKIDEKLDRLLANASAKTGASTGAVVPATETSLTPVTGISTDFVLRTLLERGYSLATAERLQMKYGERFASGVSPVELEGEVLSRNMQHISFAAGQMIIVVGPNGAGKSSLIGTLARTIIFKHRLPVRLSSLDPVRVAATDELATYADLLGTPVIPVNKLGKFTDGVTLIDTPGISDDTAAPAILTARRNFTNVITLAVVPATISPVALLRCSRQLDIVEPSGLVFSMTDQADPRPLAVTIALDRSCPLFGRIEAGNGVSELFPLMESAHRSMR